MGLDTTITSELEQIARKIEDKAGVTTPVQARDVQPVSKLRRIRDSLDTFVGSIETHALPAHTDVNAATTPTAGHYLRGSGTDWINSAILFADLPVINITDLADVSFGAGGPFLVQSDGTTTDNATAIEATNVLLRDGTRALTADWDAGAFLITSQKFYADDNASNASSNAVVIDQDIVETGSFASRVYTGLNLAVTYGYNNFVGVDSTVVRGLDLDVTLTSIAVAASVTMPQLIRAIITNDSKTAYGATEATTPVHFLVRNTNATQAFNSGGIFLGVEAGPTSGVIIGVRAKTTAAGSGPVLAYQGYAQALTGATGQYKGLEGIVVGQSTVARVTAVSAEPQGGGTFPTLDFVMAYRGDNGHWLASRASLFVTSTLRSDPNAFSTTHLTHTSLQGAGYFEGMLEVDGTLYADGDFEHAGTNLGVFGTTPAAQTAAYTQTYATATRTHANPTASALTDSTGGSADQTVAAVSGSGADTTINNNFADLADEVNKLITDLANTKQVLNQVIDDFQTYGHLQ